MITVNSISGGKTSAYIAANYKADYNIFALVTSNDPLVKYPDEKLRQRVSDKIGREFIGTLEDDIIINTIFDLEQYIGSEITWVTGKTFDDVIKEDGRKLPDVMRRFCTESMKLKPIFDFWLENIHEIVEMRIGFRANEVNRANNMKKKTNRLGALEQKYVIGKHPSGRNKWGVIEWQVPHFPLISDGIFKDNIEEYWRDKPVRFAPLNNCVGCFHRDPILLRKCWDWHPNKMEWFASKERIKNERDIWLSGTTPDASKNNHLWDYYSIKKRKAQIELFESDFNDCDTGYCGL